MLSRPSDPQFFFGRDRQHNIYSVRPKASIGNFHTIKSTLSLDQVVPLQSFPLPLIPVDVAGPALVLTFLWLSIVQSAPVVFCVEVDWSPTDGRCNYHTLSASK